jgi:transcriptional regulator with XRE-family HTH domain
MKRFTPNGGHIKELRTDRERDAGQKQFAHEVRISERKLRLIENGNAPVTADVLERIAKALGVPRQAIILEIGQQPATAEPQSSAARLSPPPPPKLVPRFDTQSATVARDESDLFETARSSHLVISHFLTRLTPETRSYAEVVLYTTGAGPARIEDHIRAPAREALSPSPTVTRPPTVLTGHYAVQRGSECPMEGRCFCPCRVQ